MTNQIDQIKVAGLQKLSLIDYPGKVAAVIFVAGCNLRCHYCHNAQLWSAMQNQIPFAAVLSYLRANAPLLDAVVISGGEPTTYTHLVTLLQILRPLGLLIKLDTNGTHPEVVQQLLMAKLVDYVALDIKAPASKYPKITGGGTITPVLETLALLRQQTRVPYMLRTTLSPFLTDADLLEIGEKIVAGAPVWQIQPCRISGNQTPKKVFKNVKFLQKYVQHLVVIDV